MTIVSTATAVVDHLTRTATNGGPLLVLIGGCSRTGKSTLSAALLAECARREMGGIRLDLDRWLIGVDRRPPVSSVIERYEIDAIVRSVDELLRGGTIYPPIYDPVTRRRLLECDSTGISVAGGVLIVEGVIALAVPSLVERATLRVFAEVDTATRLARLRMFYTITKRLDETTAEAIIQQREHEEVPFIISTRRNADLVYRAGG